MAASSVSLLCILRRAGDRPHEADELKRLCIGSLYGVHRHYEILFQTLLAVGLLFIRKDDDKIIAYKAWPDDDEALMEMVGQKALKSLIEKHINEVLPHTKLSRTGNRNVALRLNTLPRSLDNHAYLLIACGGLLREDAHWFIFSDILNEQLERTINSLARKHIAHPISEEDLGKRLTEQAKRGKEAEEFVLAYERERLASHPWVDMIVRESEDNVSAGYDVLSFNDPTSTQLNRFIEVKSYSGQKRFHWSNNEIKMAQKYLREYFIYLVEMGSIKKEGYKPEIIPDPHTWIFEMKRDWETKPDGWIVTKK